MHDRAVIIGKNTIKRNTQKFVFMIRFYLGFAIHDSDKEKWFVNSIAKQLFIKTPYFPIY